MNKLKLIVFGSLPLSTKICELLLNNSKVELFAVVLGKSNTVKINIFNNTKPLKDFVFERKIRTISLAELSSNFKKNYFDYGITCRFDRILKKEHIEKFKQGVINFHGGLLPEFGGLYSSCHTILEESKIGGGTIHFIDDKIDNGDIIKRIEFNVENDDTSETIFIKTQKSLYNGFNELLPNILNNTFKSISQDELIKNGHFKKYFDRKSISNKKQIMFDDDKKTIDKKVRAFDFSSFEPAYFVINNKKYYVRTNF